MQQHMFSVYVHVGANENFAGKPVGCSVELDSTADAVHVGRILVIDIVCGAQDYLLQAFSTEGSFPAK